MNDKKSDIDDLKFERVYTSINIPKYLVEQIKNRDFTVDEFFQYQDQNCVVIKNGEIKINLLNQLWILINDQNVCKGFVWFTIDALSKSICVHSYSIDNEYWNRGKAVTKLAKFIKTFKNKGNFKKVYWITNYPRHSEKYGFKQSKSVLMEYAEATNG